VVNFFRPAQKGADSRIDAGDTPGISKEAVAEFPHEIDLEEIEENPKMPFNNTGRYTGSRPG
jgi:hypothetical protein